MASADLYAWLVEATLATSAAIVAVLALRKPLRGAFGAGVAYAAWGLVPVALVATWLPAAEADAPAGGAFVTMPVFIVSAGQAQAAPSPLDAIGFAWLAGCVLLAIHFARQQRRFVRALGRMQLRDDGLYQAEASIGLPAAIGARRPRIVLPADFGTRYSPEQQRLMLAHEREHVARGDLLANAFVATLRCLFWFNPLLHLAARRFRDDQELACDARVIARHPHARRAYGEAMLKTQMATAMLPLGCHWGQSHPLKERIEMLKRPLPSSVRSAGGRAIVIAILLAAGYAAWAAQAPLAGTAGAVPVLASGDFTAQIEFTQNGGEPARFLAGKKFGERFTMIDGHASGQPSITASVQPVLVKNRLAYDIAMRIDSNGKAVSTPRMVVHDGVAATMRQGRELDGRFEGLQVDVIVKARDPDAAKVLAKPFAPASSPASRPQASVRKSMRENRWSSYEQLVASLSASWEPPAPPVDDC
jgi:beta-lactamase regulating signal transducer with metallopeptidase domain